MINTRPATPALLLSRKAGRKLARMAGAFANSLRHEPEFACAIAADPARFREELLRVIRAQFRLRRGRPTDPLLDRACELVKRKKSFPEVLRLQIPDFDSLDPYTRYLAAKGLRQAVARRERRSKRARIVQPKCPADRNGTPQPFRSLTE